MSEEPQETNPAPEPQSPTVEPHPEATPAKPDPATDQLAAQLAASTARVAELTTAVEQERATTTDLKAALGSAAAAYRTAALATLPEVPPELVGGETVEEVQSSIQHAKDLVEAVKARLPAPNVAQPPPAVSVPAGAPIRTEPDTSAMTATEKITYALSQQRR